MCLCCPSCKQQQVPNPLWVTLSLHCSRCQEDHAGVEVDAAVAGVVAGAVATAMASKLQASRTQ